MQQARDILRGAAGGADPDGEGREGGAGEGDCGGWA